MGLLGEIIVACGYASRPTITNALAEQRGMVLQPQAGFGSGLRGKIQRRHAERRQIQIPDADDDGNLLEDEAAENCGELPYPEFLAADVHRDPGANGAGAMREEHDAALVELELEFESTAARPAELEATLTERDADVQRLLTAGASAEAKLAQLRATIEEGRARNELLASELADARAENAARDQAGADAAASAEAEIERLQLAVGERKRDQLAEREREAERLVEEVELLRAEAARGDYRRRGARRARRRARRSAVEAGSADRRIGPARRAGDRADRPRGRPRGAAE